MNSLHQILFFIRTLLMNSSVREINVNRIFKTQIHRPQLIYRFTSVSLQVFARSYLKKTDKVIL